MDCTFDDAIFDNARFDHCQFIKCSFNRARFAGAQIQTSIFVECQAHKSAWTDAWFNDAVNFLSLKAPGSDFSGATMKNTYFIGESNLTRSSFARLKGDQISFITTEMPECCFLRVKLVGSMMMRCNLKLGDFRLATLRRNSLNQSDLTDADLFGADLLEAQVSSVNLTRASLRGANLFSAMLADSYFAGADLTGANLGQTSLGMPTDAS